MRKCLALAAVLGLFTAPVSAQTIMYLTFDNADPDSTAEGAPYTLGPGEIGTGLPAPFDGLNLEFTFKNRDGAIVDFGSTPAHPGPAQGGSSLLLGGGGVGGLRIVSDQGIAPQSFTMEAIWWTEDLNPTSNTVGIQSIIGSEPLAGQERAGFWIRTVRIDQERMDWFSDQGDPDSVIVQPNGFAADTLYHDAIVFDYNAGDPANSEMIAYRNGLEVARRPYNAAGIPTSLFGTRGGLPGNPGSFRIFPIGYNQADDSPDIGDPRGLKGGIDAVAITLGALPPEQFVLTTGEPIPFEPPLLIELESFAARSGGVGYPVRIRWSTASEIDNVGFHVNRVRFEDGQLAFAGRVNASLIPGAGTTSEGAQYSLLDPLPLAEGERRGYVLVDIDANGTPTRHGPIPVQVRPMDESGEQDWMMY